jgi:D-sedoheptulose 7-phosphate isomerase
MATFSEEYLKETSKITELINYLDIEEAVRILARTRENGGRVFALGVGGSSSTASHSVNDLRKICNIESYCPNDNVAELTALTNDVGWEFVFEQWLCESKLNKNDCLLIFSVGGGDYEKNISTNLINAVNYAIFCGATTIGIVGRDGGHVRRFADCTVLIPTVSDNRVTPHVEEYGGIILHLLVSHPLLQINKTTWESK